MGLNSKVKKVQNESKGGQVFKQDVKVRNLRGKSEIYFRILPAFNPEVDDPRKSWLPFRLPDGSLTDWAEVIRLGALVGHGSPKDGGRGDVLSMKTLDDELSCPLEEAYRAASSYPEWRYLTERIVDDNDNFVASPVLPPVTSQFIFNCVDIGTANENDVVIGVVSKSAGLSLLSDGKGLASRRAANVTDAQVGENPMVQWVTGDLTHPATGPVLVCYKETDKGKYSGYVIDIATKSGTHSYMRHPLTEGHMEQRKDLSDLTNVIIPPTEEAIVAQLVRLLNMRSPNGHHEYDFLRLVFGDRFKIPASPSAPAGSQTVQSGFGGGQNTFAPPPAAGQQGNSTGPASGGQQGASTAPSAATAGANAAAAGSADSWGDPLGSSGGGAVPEKAASAAPTGGDGEDWGDPLKGQKPENTGAGEAGTSESPIPGVGTEENFDAQEFLKKLGKNKG